MTKDEAREAALKECFVAFENESANVGFRAGFHDGFTMGYEFANKWHVIERDGLPPKNRMYLVSLKGGEVAMAWLTDDGQWGISYNEPYKLNDGDVVAYRERPMPYKGE